VGERLQVDTDQLARVGQSLCDLADTLATASADAHGLAGALGDEGLAGQVDGFAVSWDDRRAALVNMLRTLGQGCTKTATTFADADTQLASAVRGDQ
jgi:hypothetical protein